MTTTPRLSKSAARKYAPEAAKPKAYAPTGDIGRMANEAFSLKLEIDRLQAEYKALTSKLQAHCEKHNLSRIDVGDLQVQHKLRHNWTYSVGTQNEMLRVQQLQKVEQTAGIASDKPTLYVAVALSRKALD